MRLPGFCTECRRIRTVEVRPLHDFLAGVPQGICDECAGPPRWATTISSEDIRRCPRRSLSAAHYRSDGSCRCDGQP